MHEVTPERRAAQGAPTRGRGISPDPLAVIARGLAIFPLHAGSKLPAIKNWPNRCVKDPKVALRCWSPGDNIGVGCKANNLLVVDLDRHAEGADGLKSFQTLCAEHRQAWPATLTVRTPTGGLHLYFWAPRGRALGNSAGKLGVGIDTRGPGRGSAGGYVVGPGSVVDGRPYVVARELPIATLPDWLANLLDPPAPPPASAPVLPIRADRYVTKVVQEEVQRVLDAGAAGGGRNNALNRSAYYLGKLVGGGLLSEQEAESALYAAAESIGLVHYTGERQVRATIRSGLSAGARRPRVIARRAS